MIFAKETTLPYIAAARRPAGRWFLLLSRQK
jgi:hypothetical protein